MKIICIGDSLTFGYGVWMRDCWVSLLNEALDIEVLNRGTCGDTSGYLLDRTRNRLIPGLAEAGDIAIIMGGANDTLMYGANENDADNIINIAKLLSEKNVTPIIGIQPGFKASRCPFYGPLDPEDLNRNFDKFASMVISKAEAAGFALFDLRPVLKDPSLYSDGVHPTEEGHRLIYETVRETLRQYI